MLSKTCHDTYFNEALRQQAKLKLPPPPEERRYYWALNDVAVSMYIMAECLSKKGEFQEAYNILKRIGIDFPYAFCYDYAHNKFWKPAEASKKKMQILIAKYNIKDVPFEKSYYTLPAPDKGEAPVVSAQESQSKKPLKFPGETGIEPAKSEKIEPTPESTKQINIAEQKPEDLPPPLPLPEPEPAPPEREFPQETQKSVAMKGYKEPVLEKTDTALSMPIEQPQNQPYELPPEESTPYEKDEGQKPPIPVQEEKTSFAPDVMPEETQSEPIEPAPEESTKTVIEPAIADLEASSINASKNSENQNTSELEEKPSSQSLSLIHI